MKAILTTAAALALVVQAQAVTIDLRTGGTNTGDDYGNVRTFTTATGVTVEVSAWSHKTDSYNPYWAEAYLGQSSEYGLYNVNDKKSATEVKAIDNQGRTDYVQFKFSEMVDLDSIYLHVMQDWRGDFDYWTETTTGDYEGTGAPGTGGTSVSNAGSGWVSLNGSGDTNYLLIGAQYGSGRMDQVRDDQFKIGKIQLGGDDYQPSGVPDGGATVAMLGLALIGLAGAKRLKR